MIGFQTTSAQTSEHLGSVSDYLLWYAKQKPSLKYFQLYIPKDPRAVGGWGFNYVELPDGARRPLTREERQGQQPIPDGGKTYMLGGLASDGATSTGTLPFDFRGTTYHPGAKSHWKTTIAGMKRLTEARRIEASTNQIRYVRFFDDFPVQRLTNQWIDTTQAGYADAKLYVVQTLAKVVQRCILMTTAPGDLVFDPTCGSGTTAYVAEQWGRRWITCDASRVAIALAKQRLMTPLFDYYKLAHPTEGVGSGFVYKTVPHITLKSIANNPEIREGMTHQQIDAAIRKFADQETLYDQSELDKSRGRVAGPFTVEAVPSAVVRPIDGADGDSFGDHSVAHAGATLRQEEWRAELAKTGVRGKSGQRIEFAWLEPLSGTRYLHASGETAEERPKRVAVSFGPEHAPLEQRQVEQAWEEARTLSPRPEILLFASFQFDPEAAKDIDELTPAKTGMVFLRLQMNTDLLTEDLKKKRSSNESFWLMGQPDVSLRKIHRGPDAGKWEVEVLGFDYYNPTTGQIESGDTSKIAMWLLDANYDGRSLYPRQVFFPMAGPKDGWNRLAKTLQAEIDEDLIEAYRGTVSLPFSLGNHRRVAVKIVDDRGIESLKIITIEYD